MPRARAKRGVLITMLARWRGFNRKDRAQRQKVLLSFSRRDARKMRKTKRARTPLMEPPPHRPHTHMARRRARVCDVCSDVDIAHLQKNPESGGHDILI